MNERSSLLQLTHNVSLQTVECCIRNTVAAYSRHCPGNPTNKNILAIGANNIINLE